MLCFTDHNGKRNSMIFRLFFLLLPAHQATNGTKLDAAGRQSVSSNVSSTFPVHPHNRKRDPIEGKTRHIVQAMCSFGMIFSPNLH